MNNIFKKTVLASVLAVSAFSLTACGGEDKFVFKDGKVSVQSANAQAGAITKDSEFNDKAAYAIGASLATYVSQIKLGQGLDQIKNEVILQGFEAGLEGKSTLEGAEIEAVLRELDSQVQEKMEKESKADAEKNLKAGQVFLEAVAQNPDVKKTESGLLYRVVAAGNGAKAQKGDKISITYTGRTIEGTVFDEQKNPVEFALDNMIPGFVEGIELMQEGAEYELYIPAELAYGDNAVGQVIKPNSTLIFNVKLIEVKKAETK